MHAIIQFNRAICMNESVALIILLTLISITQCVDDYTSFDLFDIQLSSIHLSSEVAIAQSNETSTLQTENNEIIGFKSGYLNPPILAGTVTAEILEIIAIVKRPTVQDISNSQINQSAKEAPPSTENNTGQVLVSIEREKTGHPKLEQVLYQLAKSKDPKAFAQEKGISMKGDKVRIIIMLANEGSISGRFNITIEEQDKNLVQALVPVNELLDMANESDVNFIKVPEKIKPVEEEKSKQTSFPAVFSLVAILIIIVIKKIGMRK